MPLLLAVSCFRVKSRLVLPFWYRLTRVVPDKGPLNGCMYVWYQLDHMKTVCTSLQTDNHVNTSSLNFYSRMLFLIPNQQCQSTEGSSLVIVTHTHTFNGSLFGTTQVSQYQKGKTNLDFTEARDSGWQWRQLGYMQVCTSLQTDNHTSTPPLLCFLQAGCPSCRPTNSVKALKALFISNSKLTVNLYSTLYWLTVLCGT